MRLPGQFLILLLVLAVAGASVLSATTPHAQRSLAPPAGCHQHGGPSHPQPVSYACCQNGHNAALLPAAVGWSPALQHQVHAAIFVPAVSVAILPVHFDEHLSSGDPPGILPLRI